MTAPRLRPRSSSRVARLAVTAAGLAVALATYLIGAVVRDYGPAWADVELAFALGPVVLLICVWAGTESARRRE